MRCPEKALEFEWVKALPTGSSYGNPGTIKRPGSMNYATAVGKYIMNCCGSYEISGFYSSLFARSSIDAWSGRVITVPENTPEALLRAKQDWLSVCMRSAGFGPTYYFIATDQQIATYGGEGSVYAFLLELGARLVDDTPNQVHGPAKMMLHVWAPNLNKDRIAQYVSIKETKQPSSWRSEITSGSVHDFNPLWFEQLDAAGKAAILAKYPLKTANQLAEEEEERRAKLRAEQAATRREQLKMIEYYNPDLLKDLGFVKLTPSQRELLEANSTKVVTQSATAIAASLKGSKGKQYA